MCQMAKPWTYPPTGSYYLYRTIMEAFNRRVDVETPQRAVAGHASNPTSPYGRCAIFGR